MNLTDEKNELQLAFTQECQLISKSVRWEIRI